MRRLLESLSVAAALAGGLILAAIALLTTASILGRWLFATPILGDIELVQTGCAMMIALALPYCQLKRAHINVDFFTQKARPRVRAALDVIGSVALGAICLVLASRAAVGVADMRAAGETTMVLGFPFWMTYLVMVPGLGLSGITALYVAVEQWREGGAATDQA
jgi:TRAP-type C4-dicarboxylate transport system permease small subunit